VATQYRIIIASNSINHIRSLIFQKDSGWGNKIWLIDLLKSIFPNLAITQHKYILLQLTPLKNQSGILLFIIMAYITKRIYWLR